MCMHYLRKNFIICESAPLLNSTGVVDRSRRLRMRSAHLAPIAVIEHAQRAPGANCACVESRVDAA